MRTIPIYPDSWAELCKERAGQKYQPSNGTEGEMFIEDWCGECARDAAMSEGLPLEECDDNQKCDILGRSFLRKDDPNYPTEWQYGEDGQPRCTAFVERGQPIPPEPDTLTGDLFASLHSKQSSGKGEGRCVGCGAEQGAEHAAGCKIAPFV